jgi:hypothetical protein
MRTQSAIYSGHLSSDITEPYRPLWWIKLTQYEYWPWYLMYWHVCLHWIYTSIRSGKPLYFTAVNPGMRAGGLDRTSKKEILDLIPAHYQPRTWLVQVSDSPLVIVETNGLQFPIIAKPDQGCRGKGVMKIDNAAQLDTYHQNCSNQPYLIQEYVDYPLELGVFYSRLPGEAMGCISSLTLKEFLHVRGDGQRTLADLVAAHSRSRFHTQKLSITFAEHWTNVLPEGQILYLEPIGNHSRGTRFINARDWITPDLTHQFNQICRQIPGFYYGRFDLRVPSWEALYAGEDIKIMELNGLISEPTHIYDSTNGLWATYRDLLWHWRRMTHISFANIRQGVSTMSWTDFVAFYWEK